MSSFEDAFALTAGNNSFYDNVQIMIKDEPIIHSVAPMYDNNLSLIPYCDDRVNLQKYIDEQRA